MKALLSRLKNRAAAIRSKGPLWYYERIYARKILRTEPMVCETEGRFELHTLTCESDLINTLWSLKTFFYFSDTAPRLVIYDDGSLSKAATNILARLFVNCLIIRRDRFHKDMEDFLKYHRKSLEYTKKRSFYCALKLFGPMYYTKSEGILYVDSDVLFFNRPVEILTCIEKGMPFYMSDYQDAYSHPVEFLKNLLKVELGHMINAGLFYIAKKDFTSSMDLVEHYFTRVSKFEKGQHSVNRHEQTLAAILLSNANALRLGEHYQISKKPITNRTISHHFVNDGSRSHFYSAGLSKLRTMKFIDKLRCR